MGFHPRRGTSCFQRKDIYLFLEKPLPKPTPNVQKGAPTEPVYLPCTSTCLNSKHISFPLPLGAVDAVYKTTCTSRSKPGPWHSFQFLSRDILFRRILPFTLSETYRLLFDPYLAQVVQSGGQIGQVTNWVCFFYLSWASDLDEIVWVSVGSAEEKILVVKRKLSVELLLESYKIVYTLLV